MSRSPVITALLALLVLTAGCSSLRNNLDGKEVASVANKQLLKQNPKMVPGQLTCKNLAVKVAAKTRCTRRVELTNGRLVRIGVAVSVSKVKAGKASLSIKVDHDPEEFGLTGKYLEDDLRAQYAKKFGSEPESLTCPYLKGVEGNAVTCQLVAGGTEHDVEVTVSSVNDSEFDTSYTYSAPSLGTN